MATYTIRASTAISGPDAFRDNSGSNITFATAVGLLDDGSDTTWVDHRNTFGGGGSVPQVAKGYANLSAPTITSGEYVARVSSFTRIRYGSRNDYSGVQVYRATDTAPTTSALAYGNNSSWRTVEVATQSVGWTVSECSSLRIFWQDYLASTITDPRFRTSEIGAYIYTIARGSATSANTTMTTSSYPTVPVTVTATLDWEVETADWQHLRDVRYEVQIESGGTGAGTGTIVSTANGIVTFQNTGSNSTTVNVTMPDALSNGSYKIYVRALRYREDGSTATDTTSAWSSAYTLTMNAPSPNTPTFTVTNDTANDRIAIAVTPVTTSGWSNPKIDVDRSVDGGTTWRNIATGVAGTFGSATTIYDYTFKKGITLKYRARVVATNATPITNASAYATAISTIYNAIMWALKSPTDSSYNVLNLNVVGQPQETLLDEVGVFRPLASRYPTVVSGELGGWDGSLEITLTTANEWESLRQLIERQEVLLLESVFGWSKYIRIVGGINVTMSGTPTVPVRRISFSYVETEGA